MNKCKKYLLCLIFSSVCCWMYAIVYCKIMGYHTGVLLSALNITSVLFCMGMYLVVKDIYFNRSQDSA